MNKLTKYNQVLISILGTTVLAMLIVSRVRSAIDLLTPPPTYNDNALIVQDELDSLKDLNLRNQIVSLEGIHSFDTSTNTYLIPVYHKELKDPSSRNGKVFGIINFEGSYGDFYYDFGHYNNLVLFNYNSLEKRVLLGQRMNIDDYKIFKAKSPPLLVFTGWDRDTNNDGKLSQDDFKQLFVYDHSTQNLNHVENSNYQILDMEYLKRVDQLVFKVTDLGDSVDNADERPEFLVTYSFENNNLHPLIDATTLNQLQDIIDN